MYVRQNKNREPIPESVENAHRTRMNDSTSTLDDGLSNDISHDNFGSINDFVQDAISSHVDFHSLFSKFSEIVGNFDLPEDLPAHVREKQLSKKNQRRKLYKSRALADSTSCC